ncbi:MAG: pyruvate, water dikinase regulatory protein [Pseudomonadota bacterium]|nr:pyruvate, water dikinase regulatory protein [Pseudomonadota bacterium]
METKRTVFYLSDRTGITAETLGNSLLTQFDGVEFKYISIPFIKTAEKAMRTVEIINRANAEDGIRPLLFCTLVDDEITSILAQSEGVLLDLFGTFIGPLEVELGRKSSHSAGRAHGIANTRNYYARIEAMNFAIDSDDGNSPDDWRQADLILVGVSRSGKTPTCLYLALQYGIRAANYPLVECDLKGLILPESLRPFRNKLYGLSIDPERLEQIRAERRPNSRYSSKEQCAWELRTAQRLFDAEAIPWLNTTSKSIEEIATTILHETGVPRRFF